MSTTLRILPRLTLLIGLVCHSLNAADLFAYVTNISSNNVSAYTIDPVTGNLGQISTGPFAAGLNPFGIAMHPTRKFLYVTNVGGAGDDVSAYSIDQSTGALSPVPGSPFHLLLPGAGGRSLVIHPSGTYIYVSDQYYGYTAICTIDQTTGVLTPISGSPFNGIIPTTSLTIHPSGKFLYGVGGDVVNAYSIDNANGRTTLISSSNTGFDSIPASVAVDPTGRYVYTALLNNNTVVAYNANTTNGGGLIEIGRFATGAGPFSVTVDPSGKFVYVANANASTISAFSITGNGALATIPGSPFAAGSYAQSVTVDSTGRFLYSANFMANNVSAYSIDSATGILTPFSSPPVPSGRGPSFIAVRPIFSTPPCAGPVITGLSASPNLLWPPNHKMVPVTVSASYTGGCGSVACKIISVASNEPSDPDGDWLMTGNLTVQLRAERLGLGSGRVYTITVQCKDASGNATTKTVTVTVPHDQGN